MPTYALDEEPTKKDPATLCKQATVPHVLSQFAILVAVLASGYLPYQAQARPIEANGDVTPPAPLSLGEIWNVGGTLTIGVADNGTLTISDGADVKDSNGIVGQASGSRGQSS